MTIKVTYNVTDVYVTQDVSPVYINVSYSGGGGSGAAVWGGITGTLSNQTDLQTALDLKVPYTGATQDVSLGEYGINVGNLIYDTTPTGIPTDQGATYWDDQAETVALVMNGTIQKIGEDTFYHVKNSTGSTIAKGVAVRFAGTDGGSGKILIAPFLANGTYPSQYYMGITAEAITNGSNGKVYHFGKIRGVNTSAFADGDILYCSTTSAGGFQTTAPSAPNNIVVAAAVINAANNGTLMVRTTTGSNINTDEGVLISTPSSGQVLKYNGSLWVNDSVSGALGYTPANAATTLTINGVTYDLSANRSWTVSGGISGSGASGQVAYWTGTSAQSGSNNLFWDNANGRLGVGTNSPAVALDVRGDTIIRGSGATTAFTVQNNSATNLFRVNNDGNVGIGFTGSLVYKLELEGGNFRLSNTGLTQQLGFGFSGGGFNFIGSLTNTPLHFYVNSTARAVLFTTGNLAIGSTIDSGERLLVQGTTLLNGVTTVGDNLTVSKNQNAETKISVSNTTSGTASYSSLSLTSDSSSGSFNAFKTSSTYTTYKTLVAKDAGFYNGTQGGDFSFLNDNTTGNFKWAMGGSSTAQMTLHNTGNLLLGSTSNSGERLQVTGTMKVTGNTAISAGNLSVFTTNTPRRINVNVANGSVAAALGIESGGTIHSAIGVDTASTTFLQIASTQGISFYSGSTIGNIVTQPTNERMRLDASGNLGINATSINASAKLQIDSTTQGFLPPRMTNAQRTAISSPAVGLIVYCTDMVEGLYVYKSAGWTFVI
jgi:hypothetical protein